LRQPSRDQKRLIVAALEDAYDTNQRYKGTETDKGIADMLEDGIMAGWVAAVREDMFGPDGNEEIGSLAADVTASMKKVDDHLVTIGVEMTHMKAHRDGGQKVNSEDRLNKIVAAIRAEGGETLMLIKVRGFTSVPRSCGRSTGSKDRRYLLRLEQGQHGRSMVCKSQPRLSRILMA